MLELIRDSLERGLLPMNSRRAVVNLLVRKGDLQELKNWGPASLLCADYKILSKVLASRLGGIMGSVIHNDQTYCEIQIQVLYCDITSIVQVNRGLGAPFAVHREVRQGCSLSGMLYTPLLPNLRSNLCGVSFPGCDVSFKLSACADDVIILVNKQSDIDLLVKHVNMFGLFSSAKVNWTKSEAVMVGEKLRSQLSLTGGLLWKTGGFVILGSVFSK